GKMTLQYNLPVIKLDHAKHLTTDFGIIQFSKINQPDLNSGYTIDDNARAMVAVCQHFELTSDESDLPLLSTYLNFIAYCLQPDGNFLNYVDYQGNFTEQNNKTNLDDSNGRAIWALGYLISKSQRLPEKLTIKAEVILRTALIHVDIMHSPRAMAFAIKGIHYYNK